MWRLKLSQSNSGIQYGASSKRALRDSNFILEITVVRPITTFTNGSF